MSAIKHIYRGQGLGGLYCGYVGVQYRQASWTGAYFGSLQFFQDQVDRAIFSVSGGKNIFLSQLISGFAAGVFGSMFNTPGDVIRSVIQKRAFSTSVRPSITPAFLWSGVTEFFKVGAEIVGTKGIGGLYYGFAFKAIHLGGSGALLAWLVPLFKQLMAVTKE
jgi:solute carrier family 25 2-oxodicarboxylate transporter 21